jgi:hypothetical protein
MNDEHVIAKLRGAAAHEGPPPTARNIQAAATRGRRIRGRRHAAAAVGSGLTVAGFVALLTLVGPSGQSVVQGTTPAAGGSAFPTAVSGDQDPRERNLEMLREALGTANWRITYGTQDDGRHGATGLTLIPGSPTSHGLPNDAQAQIDFTVDRLGSAGTSDCGASGDWVAPEKDAVCATQHDADGRPVRLVQTWRPTTFTGTQSTEVGSTHLDYVRPDGISALITVTVSTPTTADTTTDAQQVKAWLPQFNNVLVTVATDPRAENDSYVPPLPPVPADVQQCSAPQINISLGPDFNGISQQEPVVLSLQNTSNNACKLGGFPKVALLDADHNALPFKYQHTGDQVLRRGPAPTVVIPPGGSAYLGINKSVCATWVGYEKQAVTIRVTLPGTSTPRALQLPRSLDWCSAGIPGSKVTVAPIEPTAQALQATH